jgi:hypothetical protein
MTKQILEFGGDLTFKIWWSTNGVNIEVGKGNQTGNAFHLIWAVRKLKEKQNAEMKAEDVDKLIQSLKIQETMVLIILFPLIFFIFEYDLMFYILNKKNQ